MNDKHAIIIARETELQRKREGQSYSQSVIDNCDSWMGYQHINESRAKAMLWAVDKILAEPVEEDEEQEIEEDYDDESTAEIEGRHFRENVRRWR